MSDAGLPARRQRLIALFDATHVHHVYLLGLAVKHRGRLATFDRSIPVKAVVGATADTLAVIAPGDGP